MESMTYIFAGDCRKRASREEFMSKGNRTNGLRLAVPFVLLVLASHALGAATSGPDEVTAFAHVNVVPMDREIVLVDMTVVVRDGKIVAVGRSEDVGVPPGATVVDGAGKYLLPGLMDMHVHVKEQRHLGRYLAYGVTTVRNMHGAWGEPLTWRD